MASFLTVLKKIGTVAVDVEHAVAPIAEIVFPQFATLIAGMDGIVQKVQTSILTVESTTLTGDAKANAVIASFEADLQAVQDFAAAAGYKATYNVAALNDAITAFVAAYNALATVKASYALVKT